MTLRLPYQAHFLANLFLACSSILFMNDAYPILKAYKLLGRLVKTCCRFESYLCRLLKN